MADTTIKADDSDDARPISLQSQVVTKSSIIDHELNRHGMDRYQWLMWGICGTGYILDAMWVQSFGLASPNIQRELGFSDKEFGNIVSAFTAGITIGAFTWGILVDIVGRRVAFLGTSFIAGAFGMCLGGLSTYKSLLVMVAFTGFGVGGNIPMDTTLTAEFLPEDRFYLLTALAITGPLGFLVCSLIAFGFIPNFSCSTHLVSCHLTGGVTPCCSSADNMGWRYLFFTIASITLAVFILRFFIFPFHESPKFLLAKGDDRGAVEVIRKIAAFNRRPCDLTVESLYERCKETPVEEETGFSKRAAKEISRLKLLFGSRRMLRIAAHLWVTWMFDIFGLYIALSYLPTILERKNSAINIGLKQTYIDYLIIYTPGIAGVIVSVLMVRARTVGRKWTLVFSSTLMAISLLLFSVVDTQAKYIGTNVLEYFCQCVFESALVGWTPEVFPTPIRGTGTGMARFFGNLVGIASPLLAGLLFNSNNGINSVLYLAGGAIFACVISLLCFPTKDMIAPR